MAAVPKAERAERWERSGSRERSRHGTYAHVTACRARRKELRRMGSAYGKAHEKGKEEEEGLD
jgi:hypothetical protein